MDKNQIGMMNQQADNQPQNGHKINKIQQILSRLEREGERERWQHELPTTKVTPVKCNASI